MISLSAFMSSSHLIPPPNADEDGLASFILSIADFAGWQEAANGSSFQIWNLRKALRGHPKGSTVSRATLERAYCVGLTATIGAKYGSTQIAGADFEAIESP